MMPKALRLLLTVSIVSLLLDGYAIQGISTLLEESTAPVKKLVFGTYCAIALCILLSVFLLIWKFEPGRKVSVNFSRVFNAFLTFLVTKLVFVSVLFLEDVYRLLLSFWVPFPDRFWAVSLIAVCLSVVPFSAFIFGITRGKYHYKVRHVQIQFEDLPIEFDGFSVAHISDVHAGSFDSFTDVSRGIELLKRQKADVFVFTGDLVNNQAAEILPYMDLFREIEAPFGKFSVLGNHDYGDYIAWNSFQEKQRNLENLKKYHAQMGFKLLLDTHTVVKKGDGRIVIVGVENWGVGFGHRGDLNKALGGVRAEDFKILLSHDPTHWASEVKKHSNLIHLTLSGHTHGMQFGIEAFGIKWSPAQYRYKEWAGLAHENGRYLYINRGFGFLGFSGRIGIWPEITLIKLRRKVSI